MPENRQKAMREISMVRRCAEVARDWIAKNPKTAENSMRVSVRKDQRILSTMNPINDLGKFLVVAGLLLAVLGLVLWSGFGKSWLGRLPGDIHYTKGNFSFYFPIVTCLLLSIVLTIVLWLFRK
jgi:uncharacterized protein YybS (DUF2232 family)